MTNFILQAAISVHTASSTTAEGHAETGSLSIFVSSSKELPRKFVSACYKACNTISQLFCGYYYFKLLGYGAILVGNDNYDRNLQNLCIYQMKEAYRKLIATTSSG